MNSDHSTIARAALQFVALSGLPAVMRGRPHGLCTLMFHGFTDRRGAPPHLENASGLHLDAEAFRAICRLLSEKYAVLPLADAAEAIRCGNPLPPNAVCLTFDDGYASNYAIAFPILREFGLPATIFAATDFVENGVFLWPDRIEYALGHTAVAQLDIRIGTQALSLSLSDAPNKTAAHGAICEALKAIPQEDLYADVERVEQRLGAALANDPTPAAIYRPLSWDQAREMQASGLIAIGAHTHHHRILGRCAAETARAEMTESLGILEHRLGSRPALFAYPNGKPGDHTAETRALLGDLGITAAVTTEQAFAGPDADPLAIPRFGHTPDPRYMDALASGTLQFVKSAIRPLRRRAA